MKFSSSGEARVFEVSRLDFKGFKVFKINVKTKVQAQESTFQALKKRILSNTPLSSTCTISDSLRSSAVHNRRPNAIYTQLESPSLRVRAFATQRLNLRSPSRGKSYNRDSSCKAYFNNIRHKDMVTE